MSTPNPGEIAKIRSNPDPRTNPARYEEPPPEAPRSVGPETTIVIGPNPTYIVDTAIAAKIEDKFPEPPEPADETPILSSIEPKELPVWAQDTEVFFNGGNFTENSIIIWNNGEEITRFISSEQISTIVKPSTVQVPPPFTLEAYVTNEGKESGRLNFTFIS